MGSQSGKITRSSKMAGSVDIQQFIKEAISKDKVVVFSKSYCPYCKLAKDVSKINYCFLKVIVILRHSSVRNTQ